MKNDKKLAITSQASSKLALIARLIIVLDLPIALV